MLRHERIERAMSPCCPTCGTKVSIEAPLRVDLTTNVITGYGIAMRVSAKHAEVVHVLADAFPRPVDRGYLEGRLWGNTEISSSLLNTTMCFVRRKLEKIGYGVENIDGLGYRLVKK